MSFYSLWEIEGGDVGADVIRISAVSGVVFHAHVKAGMCWKYWYLYSV